MGIIELIGLIVGAFIAGGVWFKGKRVKAQRKANRKAAERIKEARKDAEKDFANDADAARDWLRK